MQLPIIFMSIFSFSGFLLTVLFKRFVTKTRSVFNASFNKLNLQTPFFLIQSFCKQNRAINLRRIF